MDHFDNVAQVVPRKVLKFTSYCCLLISSVLVVVSRVGCLWITSVKTRICDLFAYFQTEINTPRPLYNTVRYNTWIPNGLILLYIYTLMYILLSL